jgi:hypothetical protein
MGALLVGMQAAGLAHAAVFLLGSTTVGHACV